MSNDLIGKVKAGELVAMVAAQVGGKGGGRPDMAQAGGSQPENLDAALALAHYLGLLAFSLRGCCAPKRKLSGSAFVKKVRRHFGGFH